MKTTFKDDAEYTFIFLHGNGVFVFCDFGDERKNWLIPIDSNNVPLWQDAKSEISDKAREHCEKWVKLKAFW